MYYNPTTQEQKSLSDLKILLNASIPSDTEQVGDDWFLLHSGTMPECDANHKIVSDGIKKVKGQYVYAYKLEEKTAEELAAEQEHADLTRLEQARAERADAVQHITVEVDGMVFDGDETAQDRMARAVVAAGPDETQTTHWVLADNSVVEVTIAQLRHALLLAGQRQSELWVLPYVNND